MKRYRRPRFRRTKKFFTTILLLLFLLAGTERYLPENWPVHGWLEKVLDKVPYPARRKDVLLNRAVDGELTVVFLDVGQGNCTLVMLDGHAMLFDCGPDDKGTYIQNYLSKQGIDRLDYVIGSHPDADHIGGMDVVLTKFECDRVFMPELERDTAAYRDVVDALSYRGYEAACPQPGTVYEFGNAQFTVLGPVRSYEESNNNSIVIRLKYGLNTFLFTGDAQTEEEQDLLEGGAYLRSDVYLAGHHGSANASSEAFLAAVRPGYTVISCGADNDYGHPHPSTLERLKKIKTKIFRTDLQGTIRVTSDGEQLWWNVTSLE